MTKDQEINRLKELVKSYRSLVGRIIEEGNGYTDGEYCVLCSGYEDSLSTDLTDDGEIEHSQECLTLEADDLDAVEI